VVIAGDPKAGSDNNFTAGMGTITVDCRPACRVSTGPGGIDPLFGLDTAEDTNCYYGELQEGSFEQLVQPFGVTRPRAIGVLGPRLSGTGLYPNSPLHVSGHFMFSATQDIVPIEIMPGQSTAEDGSFTLSLGCHWASNDQASANDGGAATANVDVRVTDAQGNSVTAALEQLTGVPEPTMLSSAGLVGGFPGVPTGVAASPVGGNDKAASVSFAAPASDGGLPITGYQVSANPSNNNSATGARSPIKVQGLSVGQTYTFTVTATNAFGAGQASAASNAITT
jgi:hypothetical protein